MTWVVPQTAPADEPFHSGERRADEEIARYRAELAAADSALGGLALDDTYDSPRWGVMTLRWAYLHVIREYSGHCGHADLIRERIDGRTYS